MASNRGQLVAERVLLFSESDDMALKEFKVKIFSPMLISPESADSRFDEGAAISIIELSGLAEPDVEIHGIDGIHALRQASDVDIVLRGVAKKNGYQFFWPSGEPYFEE